MWLEKEEKQLQDLLISPTVPFVLAMTSGGGRDEIWMPDLSDSSSDTSTEDLSNDESDMSAADTVMDIERLHEKWETKPHTQIPLGVQKRLRKELGVNISFDQADEHFDGWDIGFWSARKRRRIGQLAKAAMDDEKMSDALNCVYHSSLEVVAMFFRIK